MPRINTKRIYQDVEGVSNYVSGPVLTGVLTLLVIFYSGLVAPYLSPGWSSMVTSPMVRIIYLFIVLVARMYDPMYSLVINAVVLVLLFLSYLTAPSLVASPVAGQIMSPQVTEEEGQMIQQLNADMEEARNNRNANNRNANNRNANNRNANNRNANNRNANNRNSHNAHKISQQETLEQVAKELDAIGGGLEELYSKINKNTAVSDVVDELFPTGRVEHPDHPMHPANDPVNPYYGRKNVDVDLSGLNPQWAVKNLPTEYNRSTGVECSGRAPHMSTPHADSAIALRPFQYDNEGAAVIGNKLNPPIEGFQTQEEIPECKFDDEFVCNAGGGYSKRDMLRKKKQC